MDDTTFQPIDDEERRIMESLETALIDSAPTRDDERRKAIEAAAKEEEIPYQTLIAHLIRKYLESRALNRTTAHAAVVRLPGMPGLSNRKTSPLRMWTFYE